MRAAAVTLAASIVLLTAGNAAAVEVSHKKLFSFNGSETPAGSLSRPWGVSIDNSASASEPFVYVADLVHKVVDKYSAKGKYICQITDLAGVAASESPSECDKGGVSFGTAFVSPWGVEVDASGNVYVAEPRRKALEEFSSSGEFLKTVPLQGAGYGVASAYNAAGELLVADYAGKAVEKYDPTTSTTSVFASATPAGALGYIKGVAVDNDPSSPHYGYVYAADWTNSVVDVFEPNGTYTPVQILPPGGGAFAAHALFGLAVDPTNGHLYVVDQSAGAVYEYSAAGTYLDEIALPSGVTPAAVAVASGSDELYITAETGEVLVYGPDIISPEETVGAPTAVGETNATVTGEVDPAGGGDVRACSVEYGLTSAYGHSVPCSPAPPYSATTTISATISGLASVTTYHFRIRAENVEEAISYSADGTFATTTGQPLVGDEWALAGPSGATVNSEIDPSGYSTTCTVQYVSEAEYSASAFAKPAEVPCEPASLGGGATSKRVTANLSALRLASTYHYRFVATNSAGVTAGAGHAFTTFGFASASTELLTEAGAPYSQAGGHPDVFTTELVFNTSTDPNGVVNGSGAVKDVSVQLPPGLIGNPSAVEMCTRYDAERFQCRPNSQVGVMTVEGPEGKENFVGPLFETAPPRGVTAQFTARFNDFADAFINARVRTGEGYGVSADSVNITTLKQISRVVVKMWGVPAAATHDAERYCPYAIAEDKLSYYQAASCSESKLVERPFLTTPTSCTGGLVTVVAADAYQKPGEYTPPVKTSTSTGMTGCDRLHFAPSMSIVPQAASADSPTGLSVDLHVPQEEGARGLAEANLKDATVTLPRGVTVNPAEAAGLVGCPLEGPEGVNLHSAAPASCPPAAKIGSVELETPLFPQRVFRGGIYIAQQGNAGAARGANPFGSLVALYIAIDEPERGVVIKLPGEVRLGEDGQISTSFTENPQLPFEEMRLHFAAGARAALATPQSCGSYQPTAAFTSWAEPGTQVGAYITPFEITTAPGGAPCGRDGFAPTLVAGTQSNQGGSFSPFTMHLSRNDGEQRFSTVALRMPPGVAAILAKVPRCGEAQANAGDCPAASKIGHVTATAGVGSEPVSLPEAGKPEDAVYLTGPYKGAPFGLSIVVPAEAGPFDLGTIVDRAKINVDPHTAQVSIESDPIPTMLQGIPLDVRSIDVTVDRADFMFNPTSCDPMSVAGTIGSAEGASAAVSSRFQAAGCASLKFKPGFKVYTHKGHTRRNGAYLHVHVTSGSGQANIRSVLVKLPKILPSRTDTLKLACSAAQFAANPAGCPKGSFVGYAVARTPVLAKPLRGPAIFVSHGGAAFPDLDVVLQGEGVTVDLTGNTNIVKGITSSDFKSVPDVPIGSFDLTLPEKSNSALAATGNLCFVNKTKRVKTRDHGRTVYRKRTVKQKRNLIMPTTITGQNGAQIKQNIKITVEGCGKKAKGSKAKHGHGKVKKTAHKKKG